MKRSLLFIFAALLAPTLLADTVIRCESNDSRRHDCRFDGIGTVTIQRQLSRNACISGQTWGVRGEHIWVDRGCRAEFLVDSPRGYGRRGGETIICESSGERERCSADTHNGVRLARQISRAECIEGRSWGFNDRGIWVDHGCRAEFTLGGRGGSGGSGGGGGYNRREQQTVTCESDFDKTHKCYVDTRPGVRITRQLSRTACTYGKTWGYDDRAIWVRDGCRAEFVVGR